MSARPITKSQRRELARLNGLAHERELGNAVGELQKEIERWNRKEMDVFELNEKIHEFHHGISRDLYKHYEIHGRDTAMVVAGAIVRGILKESEVRADLLEVLQSSLDLCRQWAERDH